MTEHHQQLIDRIREGDQQALLDYLETRRADLLLFVTHQLGVNLRGKIEPEDILQELSVYAALNHEQVDFSGLDPFGWFCEIARRKILDAGRHFSAQKRSAGREVGIHGNADQSQAGIERLLIASITSPSQAFSRNAKEFKLLAAMEKMSEEQRQVLNLRYAENLPTKQIAERIGKSDGATRVLLTRSLKKLEQLIDAPSSSTQPD